MKPKGSLLCPQGPNTGPILSQLNPVHILTSCFFKIHFNILQVQNHVYYNYVPLMNNWAWPKHFIQCDPAYVPGGLLAKRPYREVKVKLFHLSINNMPLRHWEAEVQLHTLTFALDRSEWSAWHYGSFNNLGKSPQYPWDRRLGRPQELDAVVKKISLPAPARNWTPESLNNKKH